MVTNLSIHEQKLTFTISIPEKEKKETSTPVKFITVMIKKQNNNWSFLLNSL